MRDDSLCRYNCFVLPLYSGGLLIKVTKVTKVTELRLSGHARGMELTGFLLSQKDAKVTGSPELKKPGPRAAYSGQPGPAFLNLLLTRESGIPGALRRAVDLREESRPGSPEEAQEAQESLKSSSSLATRARSRLPAQVY